MRWQYRAVTLTHSANPAVPDATYYLLQGVDHTFMLLGEAGSIIRSLGNAPFLMAESKSRPLSPLAAGLQTYPLVNRKGNSTLCGASRVSQAHNNHAWQLTNAALLSSDD
ncbi:Uncharacterised protein [Burkholderia pseudomallei]|nr:Uncharacterised protein [Burkholderia pseudomallei]VCF04461.1 Uncharacterised protein [Burkholderia pseudomallei]VCF13163.1 Uncharacterised protein [Burkholderia pseudomallei]VCF26061.1 Uncharacterised protein [Burkholderia pseudomallei]VCF54352.1 Uncharacterised protein [Burkholderia pseudomallei]